MLSCEIVLGHGVLERYGIVVKKGIICSAVEHWLRCRIVGVRRAQSHRMQNYGIIQANKGEKHEYEMQILR